MFPDHWVFVHWLLWTNWCIYSLRVITVACMSQRQASVFKTHCNKTEPGPRDFGQHLCSFSFSFASSPLTPPLLTHHPFKVFSKVGVQTRFRFFVFFFKFHVGSCNGYFSYFFGSTNDFLSNYPVSHSRGSDGTAYVNHLVAGTDYDYEITGLFDYSPNASQPTTTYYSATGSGEFRTGK